MTWVNLDPTVISEFARVSQAIVAAFQGRPASGAISTFFGVSANNLEVQFVDQSTSPTGSIVAWSWTFGDGNSSTEQHPSHTYASAGAYTVTLTVTDSANRQGTSSTTVTATEAPDPDPTDPKPPTASFTASANGLTVTFTDTSTDEDGTVVAWEWDFGEGPTSAFTWSVDGFTSAFTNQATVPSPLTITNYLWNLGDGATSTSSNTVHTYASGGAKTVTLTVTSSNGNTDQHIETVSITTGGVTLGIPIGVSAGMSDADSTKTGTSHFNLFRDADSPSQITRRIAADAAAGRKRILRLAGGSATDYLTNGVYDSSKYTAKLNTFNTAAIKASVISAVSAGVVVAADVMDEPFHPKWGPKGTITKAAVDGMADLHKSIFPNLPCGVFHDYIEFEPDKSYQTIDFIIAVFQDVAHGDVDTWLAGSNAMLARDGHKALYGVNVRDGGTFTPGCDSSGDICCPQGPTEGVGRVGFQYRCRAIPSQVTTWCRKFAPHSLGILFWQWDDEYMSSGSWATLNQSAFSELRAFCDTLPASTWTRD